MFKLPRIEAAIQMVDNVSAVMRGVRASVESVTVPVNRLQNALSTLSKEAQLPQLATAAGAFKDKMGGIGEGATKSFQRLGGVLMGGAGVVAGMGAFLKTTADASDAIYDTAHRVGMTTDAFQRWRYAAQLSGSSIESSDAALERFSKGLAAARAGTGEALEPLKALGVRLKDNTGKLRSQEDVLFDVADAMAKIPDEQDKLRVSSALFGKGNQDMVAMMAQGSGAIRGMFKDFQKMGGPISEKQLETAGAFNDSLDKLHFAGMGLASIFAGQLFPVVTQLVTQFQDWALANRGALEQVARLVATNLPVVLDQLGKSFTSLVEDVGPFARALWWVAEQVGPLQFALGALAVYIAGPFVASTFGELIFTPLEAVISRVSVVMATTRPFFRWTESPSSVWRATSPGCSEKDMDDPMPLEAITTPDSRLPPRKMVTTWEPGFGRELTPYCWTCSSSSRTSPPPRSSSSEIPPSASVAASTMARAARRRIRFLIGSRRRFSSWITS